jgi:hypothetical protein
VRGSRAVVNHSVFAAIDADQVLVTSLDPDRFPRRT